MPYYSDMKKNLRPSKEQIKAALSEYDETATIESFGARNKFCRIEGKNRRVAEFVFKFNDERKLSPVDALAYFSDDGTTSLDWK